MMFLRRPRGLVVTVAVSLGVATSSACPAQITPVTGEGEGEGEGEDPNALARLRASPESLRLVVGERTTVSVVGVDNEGDDVDVSNRVSFSSSNEVVVAVDNTGSVTAQTAGEARIIASLGPLQVEVPVLVEVPQAPGRLSYADMAVAAGEAFSRIPDTDARGVVFTVQPSFPAGVTLNGSTGVITGRLDVESPERVFVVTAENDVGSVQNSVRLTVRCDPAVAVPPRSGDVPDVDFQDDNDDGVDGLACGPVFVAPDGDDDNSGQRTAPLQTLAAALALTDESPGRDIYLAVGDYQGPISLRDDVGIFGGYEAASWKQGAGETIISGGNPAVVVPATTTATLARAVVVGDDALLPSGDAVAVSVESGAVFSFVAGRAVAGRGRNGDAGAAGAVGPPGEDGDDGDIGCVNAFGCGSCISPFGGFGGFGIALVSDGGDGGDAGFEDADGVDGDGGGGGARGGLRGFGGVFIGTNRDGVRGGNGSGGSVGDNGVAGGPGARGRDGLAGGSGTGGGGGGGGAGGDFTLCDEFGGAGGGGGAGGSGGQRGIGGGAGGASIAMVVANGAAVTLRGATLVAGPGGRGGAGGAGGAGGGGGGGGLGGIPRASTSDTRGGTGGAGGEGGDGGRGGHGGGGGNSIALVIEGGSTDIDNATQLVPGSGGAGGASAGFAGQPGLARDTLNR